MSIYKNTSSCRAGFVPLLITLAVIAVSGCAARHSTLRDVLGIASGAPINVESIQTAVQAEFPLGTPRTTVAAELPPPNNPTGSLWPWFDWWDVYDSDGDLVVTSTDYASLLGRWVFRITFVFGEEKLKKITVDKFSGHF